MTMERKISLTKITGSAFKSEDFGEVNGSNWQVTERLAHKINKGIENGNTEVLVTSGAFVLGDGDELLGQSRLDNLFKQGYWKNLINKKYMLLDKDNIEEAAKIITLNKSDVCFIINQLGSTESANRHNNNDELLVDLIYNIHKFGGITRLVTMIVSELLKFKFETNDEIIHEIINMDETNRNEVQLECSAKCTGFGGWKAKSEAIYDLRQIDVETLVTIVTCINEGKRRKIERQTGKTLSQLFTFNK